VSRAAVAFPGRGAYGPSSLGSLPAGHPWVRRADELRASDGLPRLAEIDAAPQFTPALHLRATHAWPLTFLVGLLDAERIADDHEVVVVVASSIGWYTALAASGALGFDDAFRLVQTMALAADTPLTGDAPPAELVYPLADEAWARDESRSAAIDRAVAHVGPKVARALELGTFTVVAGTADGVDALGAALPRVTVGGRTYPLRLAAADAWHTPLRRDAAAQAADRLADLAWEPPNVTLVDGRGARFTPWATDVGELARQTLAGQADAPWDFARAFRVALREYAPDVILLPGPGTTLGAACAQLVVAEGYHGIRSRTEFEAVQAGPAPMLLAMRR
jgi:[acyl-carrier-protein] S-malonyltransferase